MIVAGAGPELVRQLVDLGAEAHVVGFARPAVSGIASFTECDFTDAASIDADVKKIGKIVNVLFDCAGSLTLVEAVLPNMIDGSRVVTVGQCTVAPPPGITIEVVPDCDVVIDVS